MKPSHCWKERTSSDAVTTCSMVGRGRPWIRNTQALRYMWHTRSRVDGWKAGGSSGGRSRRGNVAKLVAPEPWDLDVWLAMRSSAFDLRFRVRRDGVLLARGHAPRHVLIMCSSWHTPGSRPCATSCAQPPPLLMAYGANASPGDSRTFVTPATSRRGKPPSLPRQVGMRCWRGAWTASPHVRTLRTTHRVKADHK